MTLIGDVKKGFEVGKKGSNKENKNGKITNNLT